MTQVQFTTNIRKSVINNEYEPDKTIPNDTILTATDLEKKFQFTRAVSNRGKIDDGRKLMTSTPMILRTPRVQSLEDQSARKRWCSKRRRMMKFLREANTVSITKYTHVAREDEVSIATFAEGQQRTTLSNQTRSESRTSSVTQDAKEIIQFEHVDHENLYEAGCSVQEASSTL